MAKSPNTDTREALRRFMVKRKLRMLPWATRAGIAEGTLRSFLDGRTKSMTDGNLARLANAEGVSIEDMLGRATPTAPGARLVPVIDTVQAGQWREIADAYQPGDGADVIAADSKIGPHAFALAIVGDSMAERFQEGDRIIVDPAVEPRPGDFVVAKRGLDHEATFKQLFVKGHDKRRRLVVELRPLNPAHPVLPMDADHPGEIVGVMVEHHAYRRR